MPSRHPSPWVTLAEAAKYARCCQATLRRAVKAGRLLGVKVNAGRVYRFHLTAVDDWLFTGGNPALNSGAERNVRPIIASRSDTGSRRKKSHRRDNSARANSARQR